MWISKLAWHQLNEIVRTLREDRIRVERRNDFLVEAQAAAVAETKTLMAQKVRDDLNLDWLRHRVNALEKQNAILLQKAAGVILPVPEIVPSRPGQMSVPTFDHLPSFEDVGDEEAARLRIAHDPEGFLQFNEDMRGSLAPQPSRVE